MEDRLQIKNRLRTCVMLGSSSVGIMTFLLPIYIKKIGGDAIAIGGMFSVFSLITLIFRPLIGKGIDRFGRKNFFVCAFIFYAISMLLFSFSTNIFLLYVSRLVQAIGASFMWITAYSISIDMADDNTRGIAIGQVDGASSAGALYGAIIGFIVLGNFALMSGWQFLFKGYAVLSIAAGFIAYKYIPETKKRNKIDGEKDKASHNSLDKNFIKLLCVVFISSFSTSMLNPLLMIYLQDKFTTNIGILATAAIPAALVSAYLPSRLGSFSDKIGRIKPMVIGLVGSGIVSLGFAYCYRIEFLVAIWVLEAIGAAMASPAEEALVADMAGENIRGSAYGLYLFVASIGAVIGPLVGGWLYDYFGHVTPFYLNALILLLNAILVIVLFRKYKQQIIILE